MEAPKNKKEPTHMKRPFLHLLLLLTALLTAASCEKMSDNGKLDGMWHLQQICSRPQDNPTNGYTDRQNVRESGIYWSFQLQLLHIRSKAFLNGETSETMARFDYSGTHLGITSTYIHYRDRDIPITDAQTQRLAPLGIRGNAASFRIERLTDHHMVLCSDQDSLVFQKV